MKKTNDKILEAAVVKRLCPVCCKAFDGELIMNNKLNVEEAKKIKELHGNIIGFSKDPCEECQKIIDEKNVMFFIGIDENKTTDKGNPYRTGHVIGLDKNSEFCKSLPEEYHKHSYVYIDIKVMKEVKMIDDE